MLGILLETVSDEESSRTDDCGKGDGIAYLERFPDDEGKKNRDRGIKPDAVFEEEFFRALEAEMFVFKEDPVEE